MSNLTKENALKAMSKVIDPDLNKDLVTLNMVKDIKIDDQSIEVDVELTTPACPLKGKLEADSLAALKEEFGENVEIKVNMISNVTQHEHSGANIIPGVKNTIAVASGKGGVGKSTVAVNLAVALAKDGAKVGLIDADIYGPSIPLMLGINGRPKIYQDAGSNKMMPLENYGVKLMSIGFLIDEDNPVIWRGPMASGAIKQFLTDVDWGELDYLIFDMPPGTGDIQLTLVQTIPLTGSVIVTTPQDVSLIDAKKGLKMFDKVNVPVFGIIENMSYFIAPDTGKSYNIFGNGGGEKLAKDLGTQFLGGIPIDPRICDGGDQGKPIVHALPDTENARIISKIAQNLAAQISITNFNYSLSDVDIVFNDEN